MKKYNGWTNRDTWLANLWMTNIEPLADLYYKATSVDAVERVFFMLDCLPNIDEIDKAKVNFEELFDHCEVNE